MSPIPSQFQTVKQRKILRGAGILCLSTLMLSCGWFNYSQEATQALGRFTPLIHAGPISVGAPDGYLASNLFLKRESQRSSHLRNFLKQRGTPPALELKLLKATLQLTLFYPEERQLYTATQELNDQAGLATSEWLITGPDPISRTIYKQVRGLSEQSDWPPPSLGLATNSPGYVASDSDFPLPLLPKPKPAKKKIQAKKTLAESSSAEVQNFDQQALALSKGLALRAENGDLIHTTTRLDEQLADLVKWYTGSSSNLDQVAKYNSRAKESSLIIGEQVKIPAKLIKENRRYQPEGSKESTPKTN
jgi:hypothetical protein